MDEKGRTPVGSGAGAPDMSATAAVTAGDEMSLPIEALLTQMASTEENARQLVDRLRRKLMELREAQDMCTLNRDYRTAENKVRGEKGSRAQAGCLQQRPPTAPAAKRSQTNSSAVKVTYIKPSSAPHKQEQQHPNVPSRKKSLSRVKKPPEDMGKQLNNEWTNTGEIYWSHSSVTDPERRYPILRVPSTNSSKLQISSRKSSSAKISRSISQSKVKSPMLDGEDHYGHSNPPSRISSRGKMLVGGMSQGNVITSPTSSTVASQVSVPSDRSSRSKIKISEFVAQRKSQSARSNSRETISVRSKSSKGKLGNKKSSKVILTTRRASSSQISSRSQSPRGHSRHASPTTSHKSSSKKVPRHKSVSRVSSPTRTVRASRSRTQVSSRKSSPSKSSGRKSSPTNKHSRELSRKKSSNHKSSSSQSRPSSHKSSHTKVASRKSSHGRISIGKESRSRTSSRKSSQTSIDGKSSRSKDFMSISTLLATEKWRDQENQSSRSNFSRTRISLQSNTSIPTMKYSNQMIPSRKSSVTNQPIVKLSKDKLKKIFSAVKVSSWKNLGDKGKLGETLEGEIQIGMEMRVRSAGPADTRGDAMKKNTERDMLKEAVFSENVGRRGGVHSIGVAVERLLREAERGARLTSNALRSLKAAERQLQEAATNPWMPVLALGRAHSPEAAARAAGHEERVQQATRWVSQALEDVMRCFDAYGHLEKQLAKEWSEAEVAAALKAIAAAEGALAVDTAAALAAHAVTLDLLAHDEAVVAAAATDPLMQAVAAAKAIAQALNTPCNLKENVAPQKIAVDGVSSIATSTTGVLNTPTMSTAMPSAKPTIVVTTEEGESPLVDKLMTSTADSTSRLVIHEAIPLPVVDGAKVSHDDVLMTAEEVAKVLCEKPLDVDLGGIGENGKASRVQEECSNNAGMNAVGGVAPCPEIVAMVVNVPVPRIQLRDTAVLRDAHMSETVDVGVNPTENTEVESFSAKSGYGFEVGNILLESGNDNESTETCEQGNALTKDDHDGFSSEDKVLIEESQDVVRDDIIKVFHDSENADEREMGLISSLRTIREVSSSEASDGDYTVREHTPSKEIGRPLCDTGSSYTTCPSPSLAFSSQAIRTLNGVMKLKGCLNNEVAEEVETCVIQSDDENCLEKEESDIDMNEECQTEELNASNSLHEAAEILAEVASRKQLCSSDMNMYSESDNTMFDYEERDISNTSLRESQTESVNSDPSKTLHSISSGRIPAIVVHSNKRIYKSKTCSENETYELENVVTTFQNNEKSTTKYGIELGNDLAPNSNKDITEDDNELHNPDIENLVGKVSNTFSKMITVTDYNTPYEPLDTEESCSAHQKSEEARSFALETVQELLSKVFEKIMPFPPEDDIPSIDDSPERGLGRDHLTCDDNRTAEEYKSSQLKKANALKTQSEVVIIEEGESVPEDEMNRKVTGKIQQMVSSNQGSRRREASNLLEDLLNDMVRVEKTSSDESGGDSQQIIEPEIETTIGEQDTSETVDVSQSVDEKVRLVENNIQEQIMLIEKQIEVVQKHAALMEKHADKYVPICKEQAANSKIEKMIEEFEKKCEGKEVVPMPEKIEARVEKNIEEKVPSKTEPKDAPKTEPEPELNAEPKTELMTEHKTELKTEPTIEPKTTPKLKTEPKTELKTEPTTQDKTKSKIDPKSKSKTQPRVMLEKKFDPKMDRVGELMSDGVDSEDVSSELTSPDSSRGSSRIRRDSLTGRTSSRESHGGSRESHRNRSSSSASRNARAARSRAINGVSAEDTPRALIDFSEHLGRDGFVIEYKSVNVAPRLRSGRTKPRFRTAAQVCGLSAEASASSDIVSQRRAALLLAAELARLQAAGQLPQKVTPFSDDELLSLATLARVEAGSEGAETWLLAECQRRRRSPPRFTLVAAPGPSSVAIAGASTSDQEASDTRLKPHYIVECSALGMRAAGVGSRKYAARRAAAEELLEMLDKKEANETNSDPHRKTP